MNDDNELLQDYVGIGSEPAFTEIVERYKGLVYGAALRQTRDTGLAEEITQAVFVALSRKAKTFKRGTIVAGWLFRATCFAANDVLKSERRRVRREQLAYTMSIDESISSQRDESSAWQEIAPVLDESLARLGERDRHALLLRFFQQKKLTDVGHALGLSEAGARKCVERALVKLRGLLVRRGVVVPLALLGGLLAANGAPTIPIALSIGAAATTGTTPLVKGILLFMTWTKTKIAISAVGAGILLFGGATILLQVLPGATKRAESPAPTNQPTNAAFVLRGTPIRPAPSAVTAKDGSFVIGLPSVPRDGRAVAVVNDDAGYAVATANDLSVSPDVVVQSWGRIEGVLKVGKSTASNQTVNIGIWGTSETYEWNIVSHDMSVKTDANGRFVFPAL